MNLKEKKKEKKKLLWLVPIMNCGWNTKEKWAIDWLRRELYDIMLPTNSSITGWTLDEVENISYAFEYRLKSKRAKKKITGRKVNDTESVYIERIAGAGGRERDSWTDR